MLCQETTQQIAQKEAPTFRWTRGSNPENSRLDEILRVRRGTSTSSTLEVTLADHVEVSTGIRRTVVGCCRIPYPNRTARAVLQGNPNRAMTHILIYREAELTRKCCEGEGSPQRQVLNLGEKIRPKIVPPSGEPSWSQFLTV
jgi:hypothetical protein